MTKIFNLLDKNLFSKIRNDALRTVVVAVAVVAMVKKLFRILQMFLITLSFIKCDPFFSLTIQYLVESL